MKNLMIRALSSVTLLTAVVTVVGAGHKFT